jgi:hypothetical protein
MDVTGFTVLRDLGSVLGTGVEQIENFIEFACLYQLIVDELLL